MQQEQLKRIKTNDDENEESFYTNTSKFDEVDFEAETKEKGSKIFIIIGILALLIAKLHTGLSTDWKTTEAIFEDVKGDNLKKQFSNNKEDNKSEAIVNQLISRAK